MNNVCVCVLPIEQLWNALKPMNCIIWIYVVYQAKIIITSDRHVIKCVYESTSNTAIQVIIMLYKLS